MPFVSPAIGLALTTILFFAGCGNASTTNQHHASGESALPALNIHLEGDHFQFTTPASMCSAVLVAQVTIESQGIAHWNTSTGARPATATSANVVQNGYAIYTPVNFSGLTVSVDHRTQPTAEFATVGGQVGHDRYIINEFPQVTVGSRYVVLFAPAYNPATHATVESTLLVYDAFPITSQGVVILQAAGSATEPGQGQPQPEISMPLSQLTQQLAACK